MNLIFDILLFLMRIVEKFIFLKAFPGNSVFRVIDLHESPPSVLLIIIRVYMGVISVDI